LQQRIAICAGALALALAGSQPAAAQLVYPAYPVYPGFALVPPYQVMAIVRANGLTPLSRPWRYGPVYVLRALDPAGQPVRVVVDARSGRIERVAPVFGPRYAGPIMPPPYGAPAGRIALAPDGYGPNARVAALPPVPDGPPGYGPPGAYDGSPAGRAPAAEAAPSAQAGPPPLPRPRPRVASADTSSSVEPATAAAPQAATPAPPQPAKDSAATAPARAAPPLVEIQE
jgi:hypothetical protein